MDNYDCIVIGAGPAGLSAGIYLRRYRMNCLIISKDIGGYANEAHKIENYPGFPSISGIELMLKFKEHFESLGGSIIQKEAIGISKGKDGYSVQLSDSCYNAKTLIIAAGTKRRKLNIKGEDEFLGKGVSYCATCDAFFFKDKVVGVVGGNDSAASAAVLLAQHAKKVYIIYRKEKVRAEPHWLELIDNDPKIEVISNTVIKEIKGDMKLSSVALDSGKKLELDGLFVEIGSVPTTDIAKSIGIELSEGHYIKVGSNQETSVSGIFAAGDITDSSDRFRQIITACSEGAIAAQSAFNLIKKN